MFSARDCYLGEKSPTSCERNIVLSTSGWQKSCPHCRKSHSWRWMKRSFSPARRPSHETSCMTFSTWHLKSATRNCVNLFWRRFRISWAHSLKSVAHRMRLPPSLVTSLATNSRWIIMSPLTLIINVYKHFDHLESGVFYFFMLKSKVIFSSGEDEHA